MTIVSDSYSGLVTVVKAALTGWFRLTDANENENNFDIFLREGWSLTAESGLNSNRELCKRTSYIRTYSLMMSVEVFGTDSNETLYDDSIKKLLEAVTSVTRVIELDQTLGVVGGLVVARVVSDTGIIPIAADIKKFVMCELKIDVETFIG